MSRKPTDEELEKQIGKLGQETARRLQAEASFRSHRVFLGALVEAIPNPVFVKDKNDNYIGCNAIYADQILGVPKEEVIGRSIQDFPSTVPTEIVESKHNQGVRLICDSGIQVYEATVRCADGVERLFLFNQGTFSEAEGEAGGTISVMVELDELSQVEKDLLAYQAQLRSLSLELVLAEERQRRSLAIDLHDGIAQALAISKIKLDALRASGVSKDVSDALDEIREPLDQAIQNTRSLTFELSPPILYERGLGAAIEWLLERFRHRHDIALEFVEGPYSEPLNESLRVLLFRATRELLNNIAKHARARKAKVGLQRHADGIRIEISDDGIGFDPSQVESRWRKTEGFGLFSIRERLRHIGGRLEIKSAPGKGTRIALCSPLESKCKI